jgi:hypothetical protein
MVMQRATRWLVTAAALSALWGCGGNDDDNTSNGNPQGQTFAAKASVVSSRPDAVSGGSTLIKVTYPVGAVAKNITVTSNGTDVTGGFTDDGKGNLTGLVSGLTNGKNSLVVKAAGTVSDTIILSQAPYFLVPKKHLLSVKPKISYCRTEANWARHLIRTAPSLRLCSTCIAPPLQLGRSSNC